MLRAETLDMGGPTLIAVESFTALRFVHHSVRTASRGRATLAA